MNDELSFKAQEAVADSGGSRCDAGGASIVAFTHWIEGVSGWESLQLRFSLRPGTTRKQRSGL